MMKTFRIIAAAAAILGATSSAQAAQVDEIIVEALIDGSTTFHVRPDSVWWESHGVGKPGKWSGQDEPTYINGVEWKPRWRNKEPVGTDKTAPYSISLKTTKLEFELLSVTKQRGESGIEKRTPVTARLEGGHFVVRIPDPEVGARWYKFAVRKKK